MFFPIQAVLNFRKEFMLDRHALRYLGRTLATILTHSLTTLPCPIAQSSPVFIHPPPSIKFIVLTYSFLHSHSLIPSRLPTHHSPTLHTPTTPSLIPSCPLTHHSHTPHPPTHTSPPTDSPAYSLTHSSIFLPCTHPFTCSHSTHSPAHTLIYPPPTHPLTCEHSPIPSHPLTHSSPTHSLTCSHSPISFHPRPTHPSLLTALIHPLQWPSLANPPHPLTHHLPPTHLLPIHLPTVLIQSKGDIRQYGIARTCGSYHHLILERKWQTE